MGASSPETCRGAGHHTSAKAPGVCAAVIAKGDVSPLPIGPGDGVVSDPEVCEIVPNTCAAGTGAQAIYGGSVRRVVHVIHGAGITVEPSATPGPRSPGFALGGAAILGPFGDCAPFVDGAGSPVLATGQ